MLNSVRHRGPDWSESPDELELEIHTHWELGY